MNFPQSSNEARSTFLVNLAGVYSLRSEFDKARKCLQQVSSFTTLNTWKFFGNDFRRIFADYILSNICIHEALVTLSNLYPSFVGMFSWLLKGVVCTCCTTSSVH